MREDPTPRRDTIGEASKIPAERAFSKPHLAGRIEGSDLPGLDVSIARLAARRRGIVTRGDLLALGMSSSAIGRRVASGRLHAVHPSVYAVGHPILLPLARELAALMACGPAAVLSHSSAAIVWRLMPFGDHPPHVTLPHARGPAKGIVIHRTSTLQPADVRIREGLPITALVRTLVDLAATDRPSFEHALNEALVARLATPADLDAALAHRRRGTARLRTALDRGPTPSRSEAERRLLAVVEQAGLPRPATNARIGGHEVDAVWMVPRVIVEVDGYGAHSTRHAFEADRLRDAELQNAGYLVLRITWRQLARRAPAVAARLAVALERDARG